MSASWKTVRVFISSTFRDMQAERDWLVRFVFPKLREELLPRRISISVDVDLRWGVTFGCRMRSECAARSLMNAIRASCASWADAMAGFRKVANIPSRRTNLHMASWAAKRRIAGMRLSISAMNWRRRRWCRKRRANYRELSGSVNAAEARGLEEGPSPTPGLPVCVYPARWDAAQQRLTGLETFGQRVHADLLQSLKRRS